VKATIDLNVLLDVLQRRTMFMDESASVLDAAFSGRFTAVLPAHAITTVYYVTRKIVGAENAVRTVRQLLGSFQIAACDASSLTLACDLDIQDYEDAVTAALAAQSECEYIVTRDVRHFAASPVPAIVPGGFLMILDGLA
jgi:predicted nucleic acid-binding protein